MVVILSTLMGVFAYPAESIYPGRQKCLSMLLIITAALADCLFNTSPINHNPSKFPLEHEQVTFVGRPFPLEDAPEQFARLRRWGLTFGALPYACPASVRPHIDHAFKYFKYAY